MKYHIRKVTKLVSDRADGGFDDLAAAAYWWCSQEPDIEVGV